MKPLETTQESRHFLTWVRGLTYIRELAEQVADMIGYKGTIKWDHSKPDGTPKKQLDISRLESMGWRAKISQRGLARTVEDFRQSKRHRGIEN